MSVYFYGCITLDGYLADKNHQLGWLYESGSSQETTYDQFYKNMDITIMGKSTFNAVKDMDNIGDFYATTDNYVFTHDKTLPIDIFKPVSGDVASFVKSFDSSKNIWIVGGNTLVEPIIDNDMFDTLYIQVAPVLLGAGVRLFTQKDNLRRYHLQEVHKYGQFAEMVYKKISKS